jgi:hypothetical protein
MTEHTKIIAGETQICTDDRRVSFFDHEYFLNHPLLSDYHQFNSESAESDKPIESEAIKSTFPLGIIDQNVRGINFDGLPDADIRCIARNGFDTWLNEYENRTEQTYRALSETELSAIKYTDINLIEKLVRSVRRSHWHREKFYERGTIKLAWFLKAGYSLVESKCKELSSTTLISFYSDCTDEEMKMSDKAFASIWSDESAHTRRRIRIEKGHLQDDSGKIIVKVKKAAKRIFKLTCEKCNATFPAIRHGVKKCQPCGGPPDPTRRYCSLGPKCFRGAKNRPMECKPNSPYCSETCKGAFQASVNRSRRTE